MQASPDTPTRPPSAATPPPATDRPPPGRPGDPPAWPPPPPDSRRFSWRPPSLSAAAWLASTGAALLLIASIVAVASRWESVPAEARFAGLVAALIAAYSAAEAGRRRVPATAKALATLAATITAPVGVAALASLGQPWSIAVFVGGLAALVTAELQSRRWDVPVLKVATVLAFGMAATGAAALTGVPVSLIGAIGAAIALSLGATRRSVALGAAVGLSPALVLLAEAGVGAGTLARIGAVGDSLTWATPTACAIAAVVIGITAQRRQNLALAVAAVAVLASGVVTALAAGEVGDVVWWCLPGVTLLLLESLGTARRDSVWRPLSAAAPLIAVPSASVGLLAPILLAAQRVEATPIPAVWSAPLLFSTLALVATAAGSARRTGNDWLVAGSLVGAAGAAVGAATLAGTPFVLVGLLALLSWAAISAVTDWRTWDVLTGTIATWGLFALSLDAAEPLWAQIVLIAGFGLALVLAVSFVERADEGFRLVLAALATGGAMHLAAGDGRPVEALLTMVAMLAVGATLRPDRAIVPVSAALAVVALSFLDGVVDWWNVTLVAALATACAGAADRSLRSPWAHLAAGFAIAAGALGLYVAGLEPTAITLLVGAAAIALTGLAALRREYLPVDTGAVVAGGLALAWSFGAEAVFVSLAAALVGAQAIAFGATRRDERLTVGGAVGFGGAVGSLWWTTGTNALVIEAIAPYGATGVDIVVGVTGLGLLGLGWILRRRWSPSSWLAYGPGLGLLAAWLLSTQSEAGAAWATFGALAVGVIATGIGGLRRLGAPLVVGTLMTAGTLVVSAGPRLAEAPTWAWIAIGGTGLLALAALVERSERPLLPTGDSDDPSIVESFLREFQ